MRETAVWLGRPRMASVCTRAGTKRDARAARTLVVVTLAFLFIGLVLPAPQNDMELQSHDPSAALVTGAHHARVVLKQAPRHSAVPLVRVLCWVILVLVALASFARRHAEDSGWTARSLLRRFDAPLRGPPLTI
jgi:hypothetical protein